MQSFVYFQELVKAWKLWVFHHKIFYCICTQVTPFSIFFNCIMYGAYEISGIITHLFVNILVSKLFLSLFNTIIPILDNKRGTLISAFYNNVFVIFEIIKCTRLFPIRFLYLFCRILICISFSSKLLRYISIAASLFLGLEVDFSLKLFLSNPFLSFRKCHFKRSIVSYASSSILSFALLICLLVGINFNLLDNNQILVLVSFRLDKLATFLVTNLPLIRPFKANTSVPSSLK